MTVDSTPGQGSRFTITLPVQVCAAAPASVSPTSTPAVGPSSARLPVPQTIAPASLLAPASLTPDTLQTLPAEWLGALHQAACQCNDTRIRQLVQTLPNAQIDIAQTLVQLASEFQFDQILSLTTPLVSPATVSPEEC